MSITLEHTGLARAPEVRAAPQAPGPLQRLLTGAGRRYVGVGLLILILGFLTVYPLSMLLYGSLHSTPPGMAGEFNLDGYRKIVTAENVTVLLNTVGLSLAKTMPAHARSPSCSPGSWRAPTRRRAARSKC